MKIFILIVVLLLSSLTSSVHAAKVTILCYHEVDNQSLSLLNNKTATNIWSVSSKNLRAHFEYLRSNGYRVISATDYINANYSGDRNIIISFDDGYESFYSKVFPLLKEFNYPAVLSIHNEWLNYKPPDVGQMLSIAQLQDLSASSLVELASHTYASHKNKPINPQGSLGSIMENRLYLNGRYETDAEFASRLNNDFASAQNFFLNTFGKKARILAWPYGRYSGKAIELAVKNGFEVTFLLDGGSNDSSTDSLLYSKRYIVYGDLSVKDFAETLTSATYYWRSRPLKMAMVEIDRLYSADQARLDENINLLVTRLKANKYNTVALQTFCNNSSRDAADSVYFYTKQAPVKVDVFAHIANKLSQSGLRVIAWMPTLSASWLNDNGQELIQAYPKQNIGIYSRVTPFAPLVREKLVALYIDLANYSNIDGVLFGDDLYMNGSEDISNSARQAFAKKYGYELTIENLTATKTQSEFLSLKITSLDSLSVSLKAAIQQNRPASVFVRTIYEQTALDEHNKSQYAQDLRQYLANYDYTMITAYPSKDNPHNNPLGYWQQLAANIHTQYNSSKNDKLIIKISKTETAAQLKLLPGSGIINIALDLENIQ